MSGFSIKNSLNTTNLKLDSIIGKASTSFTGMWNGGFAGINANGIDDLKRALNKYINNIEDCLINLNTTYLLDESFQGRIRDVAIEYVDSIKAILRSYISTLRININDLDYSFNVYMEATDKLANQIFNDSSDVGLQVKVLRDNTDIVL